MALITQQVRLFFFLFPPSSLLPFIQPLFFDQLNWLGQQKSSSGVLQRGYTAITNVCTAFANALAQLQRFPRFLLPPSFSQAGFLQNISKLVILHCPSSAPLYSLKLSVMMPELLFCVVWLCWSVVSSLKLNYSVKLLPEMFSTPWDVGILCLYGTPHYGVLCGFGFLKTHAIWLILIALFHF